eukprot:GHVU01079735.1.p2 GENE.GHVU01079735.1~~GHVU01079735.1.p2  ORF type:complete len:120 (+),score=11.87 GHVU01079735.1:214-573(+)
MVQWTWHGEKAARPDLIYLHLLDDVTDTYVIAIQFGHPIPNTGSFTWTADVPFAENEVSRAVNFVMTATAFRPFSKTPAAEVGQRKTQIEKSGKRECGRWVYMCVYGLAGRYNVCPLFN